MPDTKISDLPAATTVAAADLVAIVQGGTNKKAAKSLLGAQTVAAVLTADFPVDADTMANIAGLSVTVEAATYIFELFLPHTEDGGFLLVFDLGGGTATVTHMLVGWNTTHQDGGAGQTAEPPWTTALATDVEASMASTDPGRPVAMVATGTITINAAGTLIPRAAFEEFATGGDVYRGAWIRLTKV